MAVIDKGQKEKRALTRRYRKVMRPLPTTFERYRDTLARLGLTFEPRFKSIYPDGQADITGLLHLTGEKGMNRWVGIAPIVKHKAKAYPPEQMERIVSRLHHLKDVHIFLFGGGHLEESVAHTWASTYKGVTSVIGKLSMGQELALMSHMDVMVTMDSGNMHLASLVGTPVVSIWGSHAPLRGFPGLGADGGQRRAGGHALPALLGERAPALLPGRLRLPEAHQRRRHHAEGRDVPGVNPAWEQTSIQPLGPSSHSPLSKDCAKTTKQACRHFDRREKSPSATRQRLPRDFSLRPK